VSGLNNILPCSCLILIDQEDDQKTDGGIVYKQTLRSVKLTTGRKVKRKELTGKGPLRR
jgi:hypothetical protein